MNEQHATHQWSTAGRAALAWHAAALAWSAERRRVGGGGELAALAAQQDTGCQIRRGLPAGAPSCPVDGSPPFLQGAGQGRRTSVQRGGHFQGSTWALPPHWRLTVDEQRKCQQHRSRSAQGQGARPRQPHVPHVRRRPGACTGPKPQDAEPWGAGSGTARVTERPGQLCKPRGCARSAASGRRRGRAGQRAAAGRVIGSSMASIWLPASMQRHPACATTVGGARRTGCASRQKASLPPTAGAWHTLPSPMPCRQLRRPWQLAVLSPCRPALTLLVAIQQQDCTRSRPQPSAIPHSHCRPLAWAAAPSPAAGAG